jgi:hypothetical protein
VTTTDPLPAAAPAPRPVRLDFGGRVFVLDQVVRRRLSGGPVWSEDLGLSSARAFLDYRPNKKLRMVLEVEFSDGDADLKDTYLRYRPVKPLTIMAGRFKRPISFIALESAWSLPRVGRGLLSDFPAGDVTFAGGRGDGAAIVVSPDVATSPELTVTVMESRTADDAGANLDASEDLRYDAYGRFELEPVEGLHLAVAGGWVGAPIKAGTWDTWGHRSFGTVEGYYESEVFRAWLEGMAGLNTSRYDDDGRFEGSFRAARALVSPRVGGLGESRGVEPYVAASWIDTSTATDDDQVVELTGGLAVWISRHLRAQLEGVRWQAQSQSGVADATMIRLQVGAAFEGTTALD